MKCAALQGVRHGGSTQCANRGAGMSFTLSVFSLATTVFTPRAAPALGQGGAVETGARKSRSRSVACIQA